MKKQNIYISPLCLLAPALQSAENIVLNVHAMLSGISILKTVYYES